MTSLSLELVIHKNLARYFPVSQKGTYFTGRTARMSSSRGLPCTSRHMSSHLLVPAPSRFLEILLFRLVKDVSVTGSSRLVGASRCDTNHQWCSLSPWCMPHKIRDANSLPIPATRSNLRQVQTSRRAENSGVSENINKKPMFGRGYDMKSWDERYLHRFGWVSGG